MIYHLEYLETVKRCKIEHQQLFWTKLLPLKTMAHEGKHISDLLELRVTIAAFFITILLDISIKKITKMS